MAQIPRYEVSSLAAPASFYQLGLEEAEAALSEDDHADARVVLLLMLIRWAATPVAACNAPGGN